MYCYVIPYCIPELWYVRVHEYIPEIAMNTCKSKKKNVQEITESNFM